jgi:hypothetical protein
MSRMKGLLLFDSILSLIAFLKWMDPLRESLSLVQTHLRV